MQINISLTIGGEHHQAELLLPISNFCRRRMMQTVWISSWDENGGGL